MPTDDALRAAILSLLAQRDPGKTICPSDAARAVGGDQFRKLMAATRQVAGELVREGRIEVTQKGEPVELATARGPIRLRLIQPSTTEATAETPPDAEAPA